MNGVIMPSDTLATFGCSTCSLNLGWTAPGEAKRIGQRARIYCDDCKDRPEDLTDRQTEFVNLAVEHYRATGTKPSLAILAERMGISRSRAQQLRDVIRRRRPGLLENLGDAPVAINNGLVAASLIREARASVALDKGDGQTQTFETLPPPPAAFVAPPADNPEVNDPASAASEFL